MTSITGIWGPIKKHNLVLLLALIAIGFALLWFSTYLDRFNVIYTLMINLGSVLIVSAIAMWILSYAGREIQDVADQAFQEFKGIYGKFQATEDSITSNLGNLKDELINKLDILAEAKKCGVVHIFESRRKDPNYKRELIKQLKCTEKQEEVLIMSNSLRDFFGPVHNREYLLAIFEMLRNKVENKVGIRVLLLDPTSDASIARAMVEEKEKVDRDGYIASTLFTEIKNVAEWLNNPPESLDEEIREKIKKINVRFFPYDPTTHIIRTGKFTFIEQYHRGGDKTIRKDLDKNGFPLIDCFGGYVPVLMVNNSAFFAELMKSHFNNIWGSEDVEERDLRDRNYYQKILEFEETYKKSAKAEE